jgi:hypothetical protein
MPIAIRCALLSRLALQVHPPHPERADMAQLPLPQLPRCR